MRTRKPNGSVLFLAGLLWLGMVQAQESVNASGNNATGSGGSASYSIGQVFHLTISGTTGNAGQGVQHAYEIYTAGDDLFCSDLSVTAFPNPTADNIILQEENYTKENRWYQLFDMQGNLLAIKEISTPKTQIYMAHLAPGAYLIHVLGDKNLKIRSFKVIKK